MIEISKKVVSENISSGNLTSPFSMKLISKQEYCAELRKYLHEECFKLDKRQLLHYFLCILLYIIGIWSVLNLHFFPIKLLLSILLGVILSSLTFLLHDLFHGSIVKSKPICHLIGLSIGIFNLFVPFFWQRLHSFHHATTGSVEDPDRSYILKELPKNVLEKFAYKTRISNEAFHPLLSLIVMSTGFFWYFLNTMFYGLIANKVAIRTENKYEKIQELFKKKSDKLVVFLQLSFIFCFQLFLFFIVSNSNLLTYVLISIIPILISHFVAMSYIHTNHFLSPLTGEIDDPLINSLSLKNSKLVDWLFSNFSHHVEHHLFPSVSSLHYPKVRKLLLKLYPERFQLLPMIDVIKLLFKTPRIYDGYFSLVTSDRKQKVNCLMPRPEN